MELNIFGDIAGQYEALMKLIDRMPKSAVPFSLGDMNDRGPKSMEVINFFMKNGMAVNSNHGHFMVDALLNDCKYYGDPFTWMVQGGLETVYSYLDVNKKYCFPDALKAEQIRDKVRKYGWDALNSPFGFDIDEVGSNFIKFSKLVVHESHLKYLENLPMFVEYDDIILTHAPINPSVPFYKLIDLGVNCYDSKCERSLIWNRGDIRKRENQFQIHGHNKVNDVLWYKGKDGAPYGANIDTSRSNTLTGIHWPSMEIFQEAY